MYHVTLLYKNSISTLVGLNIPCLGRSKQTLCWGGGVKGNFFGRINFMLWAQVLSFMRETCGEVTGLRRPIGSKPPPKYGSRK